MVDIRDFIDFTLFVLFQLVDLLFSFDLGNGYTLGGFLLVTSVVSVFIGSLVIKFRNAGNPASVARPVRSYDKGGD